MKRIISIISLAAFFAASVSAQTMYDGLMFSRRDYSGSARTLAMGNAFTALGGDLGSITINPAGGSVAGFTQLTFSPGILYSVNTSNGTLAEGERVPSCFDKKIRNSSTNFFLPNIGFEFNFNLGGTIRDLAIGFVSNATNVENEYILAKGTNSKTSFSSGLATMTYGFANEDIAGDDAYERNSADNWKYVLGWGSYMINPDTTDPYGYVGVAENQHDSGKIEFAGPVDQTFGKKVTGVKYDMALNLAMNIADYVHIGANLGIISNSYASEEYFNETPEEPSLFNKGFTRLNFNNRYKASMSGVYGKFGVIVTPEGGFRVGAAIQTPTALSVSETWSMNATVNDADGKHYDETPDGTYSYRLISPMRFNAGIAYTFAGNALVSADYEMCNYKSMRFKELTSIDDSNFDSVNDDIRYFMGTEHSFRLGAEYRPIECFSLRAGYGLNTLPDKYEIDGVLVRNKSLDHKFSFGLGYSTKGTFFIDAAVAYKKFAKKYIVPYEYALMDEEGIVIDTNTKIPYVDYNMSPEIVTRRGLWSAIITLGFRF